MKLIYFLLPLIPLSFITGWIFLYALTVHPANFFSAVFVFALLLSLDVVFLVMAIRERIDSCITSFDSVKTVAI